MQASIDFDGTLTGSIAGGGSGGSDVSITPTYYQGKKIADYSIDGNEGAIYMPEIEISKNVLSGVKICEIEGVEIYCPSYGYIDTLGDSNVEQIGGFSEGLNVTPVKVKRVSYTNDVSNGEKIGSLTVGDTSYNIYQKPNTSTNYSTTEHDTGKKWINGKTIYRKVFVFENVSAGDHNFDTNISNVDEVINQYGTFIRQTSDFTWTYSLNSVNEVSNTDVRFVVLARYKNTENKIYVYVASGVYNPITKLTFIIEYTKE